MEIILRMLFFYLFTFPIQSFALLQSILTRDDSIATAVSQIISDTSLKTTHEVCITVASSDSKAKQNNEDILNEVLKKVTDKIFLIQMESFQLLGSVKTSRFFHIFFIDDYKSFQRIFQIMNHSVINNANFLIVHTLMNNEHAHIDMILRDFWSIFIFNVNILHHLPDEDKISLYTFFTFEKFYCNEIHLVLWKTFKNGKFQGVKEFYPKKMRNLFNCPVRIGSFNSPPFMVINTQSDGSFEFDGLDGNLLLMLADQMNFKINLTKLADDSLRWGTVYENGSSRGAIKMVSLYFINYNFTYLCCSNV